MIKYLLLLTIILLPLLFSLPCTSRAFDGHPALVLECRHQLDVRPAHLADRPTHGQSSIYMAYPAPGDDYDPYPPPVPPADGGHDIPTETP